MSMAEGYIGQVIRITGVVQGVGFRPFVWHLARNCGIRGIVYNDGRGVMVRAWGRIQDLQEFNRRLKLSPPPLARIEHIERYVLEDGDTGPPDFAIVGSRHDAAVHTDIAPDTATCPACLEEILRPDDRRYRYAFTNCTHCGPRLSIIRAVPYDRVNTSMSEFAMCPACQAEYDNPGNRRFHAQPHACPVCGPRLWLEDRHGHKLRLPDATDIFGHTQMLIRDGAIIAIKGIGGVHLACDATNDYAVGQLRERKGRYAKAFALMARDISMVRRYARIPEMEQRLLCDPAAPIVILKSSGCGLSPAVAPGQGSLGFMLPYSPLHHLLMAGLDHPVVLTSGNISDEPQCTTNEEVREHLAKMMDYALLHDRKIVNRLDDSVMHVIRDQGRMLRRARGYAPSSLMLPPGFDRKSSVLAMGGELKNTFSLLQDGKVIMSQYIGDLGTVAAVRDYQVGIAQYQDLYAHRPQAVAIDMHDEYHSTLQGRNLAGRIGVPLLSIQHHHAHVAAVMAEYEMARDSRPVLGVVLDGLGLGDDGTLWGAEFLLSDYTGYRRLACFQPLPLLGGDRANREPWRNTFAYLAREFDWELLHRCHGNVDIVRFLSSKPVATLQRLLQGRTNSPLASSAGRLFDAVAAALGICREQITYEGQAAMELEALAGRVSPRHKDVRYRPLFQEGEILAINWGPMWRALLNDLQHQVRLDEIAGRFHHAVAQAVTDTVLRCRDEFRFDTVVLSGGVFQNRLLAEQVCGLLEDKAFEVLLPARYPCNDGGLSLGQAVIAAARMPIMH